jgi:hypothetical protein
MAGRVSGCPFQRKIDSSCPRPHPRGCGLTQSRPVRQPALSPPSLACARFWPLLLPGQRNRAPRASDPPPARPRNASQTPSACSTWPVAVFSTVAPPLPKQGFARARCRTPGLPGSVSTAARDAASRRLRHALACRSLASLNAFPRRPANGCSLAEQPCTVPPGIRSSARFGEVSIELAPRTSLRSLPSRGRPASCHAP